MRSDALGFFWQDLPEEPKQKAEKQKRTPPERTWERPDYLPGLQAALELRGVPVLTPDQLMQACVNRRELVYDCEVYPNYFLAAFMDYSTGGVTWVEFGSGETIDQGRLRWLMESFITVGFNSITFDNTVVELALAGCPTEAIAHAAKLLIEEGQNRSDVRKQFKAKKLKVDHIDLIEVAPLRASLKIYGGRLHVPRMQDLPFPPGTVLSPEQKAIVRYYCVNDLRTTAYLRSCLNEQLSLRRQMSEEYGLDLRSKSDAQIAEAVIGQEMRLATGLEATRPTIDIGTAYRYRVPAFLRYTSPTMQWTLEVVRNALFIVGASGAVGMPPELANLEVPIAGGVYRMGIGGLHSSESKVVHKADADYFIEDRDVTSYYPRIILNQELYPHHLGPPFLRVYKTIVDRRIAAKQRGDKVAAETLKITINGSFGKLGSKYSILYSPDLLIQVTVTGQLSLLMLIERFEIAGITVVSANTDGIVVKCLRSRQADMEAIVRQWEHDTDYETEATRYLALYSRDVNSYIGVKDTFDKERKVWTGKPGGTKNKGAFANPWSSKKMSADQLHKNPSAQICVTAVDRYLIGAVPLLATIAGSTDIRDFVCVRKVKGGAVQGDEYLGGSVRWYYSIEERPEMVYANNGNRVPKSAGAKPLLELPSTLPPDVDFEWYEREATTLLASLGLELD